MASHTPSYDSTATVLILLFVLIILALALVYFYKRLNVDTNGQYTVQNIVFAPGGLRDRLRQGVGVVENRFGVHIWPQPREDEENIGDSVEEEGGGHDKQNDSYTEGEQQENDDGGGDSSSDYSSVDLRERAKTQADEKKSEKNEAEEEKKKQKEEEKEEAAEGEEHECGEKKNEEKVGLLVDLTPFSGSAIWSEPEEDKVGNEGNDLTAL
ncbi:30 kDa salivary gland allergen Aed a 3 [Rhinichthys klamathensis goyatoka]|uniref:30 kDa salivary gland allergen Aed a 3 n=1 Tax=Rhinichthys klamathensis goyatoka TaxID=3034132 RepID=UPI0024B53D8F|nr:30 kDa salivary gland allergen Aed a 3 [Rhinichthys klamathensis goyatoka]